MCADNTYYTGITIDIERRLKEHNASDSKGSKYVNRRRPAVLVYKERADGRQGAMKRELAIKKMSKKAKTALVEAYNRQEITNLPDHISDEVYNGDGKLQ